MGGFVRILCVPVAGVEAHSTVLILKPGKPVDPDTAAASAAPAVEKPADKAAKK